MDIWKNTDNTKMEESAIVNMLREFIEDEARSCSMDFGCITPQYVQRMWGGKFSLDEIDKALKELRASGFGL